MCPNFRVYFFSKSLNLGFRPSSPVGMISASNEAKGFSASAGERWLALVLKKVITCKCCWLTLPPECPTPSVSAGEIEHIVYSNNTVVSMVMNGGILESAHKVGKRRGRRSIGRNLNLSPDGDKELVLA